MVDGGFAYGYLFISQHPLIKEVFSNFLKDVRPARILEIGTFHGGLTLMLRDIMDNEGLDQSPILTYDIHEQTFLKPLVGERNIIVKTKNIFNDTYTDFKNQNYSDSITNFIQADGTTLVLCDGGCKVCEYNILTPLLKNRDIIMAHDYSPNKEYFETKMKDKIWDWHEINDEDIREVSEKYNLDPYYQSEFLAVAWNCRRKHGK